MRLALLVVAVARVAAAEPPGIAAPVQVPAPVGQQSYRLETVCVDGVAISLTTWALSSQNSSAGWLAAATYLAGGPIVHLAHDRPLRAAGSLGLRLALPIIGGLIGSKQGHCSGDVCGSDQTGFGVFTGVVAAAVVDSLWLAEGDGPPAPTRASWSPTMSAGPAGVALGLAGSF
jgi:hypothetical protein